MGTTTTSISEVRDRITELKAELAALQKFDPPQKVQNYTFIDDRGQEVSLLDVFGDYEDLIVVHNMGAACDYCSLWADGLTGFVKHISERCAFVVVSPDQYQAQKKIKEKRGWTFDIVSYHGSSFATDMGFWSEEEGFLPGFSTFSREGDSVVRVACDTFGPGDDYCAIWPMFALLKDGDNGWEPD